MTIISTGVIEREDIVELIYTLFKNYKFTNKFSDEVPNNIMNLLVSLSENLKKDEKIYNFIFSLERDIIFICIKYYTKNNTCYVKILQLLNNIFKIKNLNY